MPAFLRSNSKRPKHYEECLSGLNFDDFNLSNQGLLETNGSTPLDTSSFLQLAAPILKQDVESKAEEEKVKANNAVSSSKPNERARKRSHQSRYTSTARGRSLSRGTHRRRRHVASLRRS